MRALSILMTLVAAWPCLLAAEDRRAQRLKENAALLDSIGELPMGLGTLPDIRVPPDNPQSPGKIGLGRRLFFEKNLSADRNMSCATCHDPAKGFSDGRPRAVGFHHHQLPRHTPSLWNAAYNASQFWDGRAASLEQQAKAPITSPSEMNLSGPELATRLAADVWYRESFRSVFGQSPSLDNAVKAIAAFERTLTTGDSQFDRYARGEKNALTLREKNGLVLFIGKAQCARCHNGPNFTDNKFQNTGIGDERDRGRFEITRKKADRAAFKTPSLRNAALHAPYMHDGSLPTLEAVIAYYDRGGNARQGKSPFVKKIGLTGEERHDLASFLKSLTDATSLATAAK